MSSGKKGGQEVYDFLLAAVVKAQQGRCASRGGTGDQSGLCFVDVQVAVLIEDIGSPCFAVKQGSQVSCLWRSQAYRVGHARAFGDAPMRDAGW